MTTGDTALPPDSRPFPRLQISDLLVLTLTTAFGLAWMEALGDSDPPSRWDRLLSLWEGGVVGVSFFGFAVLLREILNRGRTLSSLSPAHVWFLVAAPQLLLGLAHTVIAYLSSTLFSDMTQWRAVESGVSALSHLIFVAVWLLAAVWVRPWPWRIVVALKGIEQAAWVALHGHRALRTMGWAQSIPSMHFFGVIGSVWSCLLVALLISVVNDVRRKVARDWLHYVGVGLIVAESLEFYRAWGRLAVRWWTALYQFLPVNF
jgi:hypothetical protein